ncbi:peroxidase family protein [Humisphaera borealis]|uniref:peroxidase family protein n=1 Tax=Humisphaera borealis TaxID=2807512 RepID=UPI0019D160DE|nr:peroxidase family protein [Humisphaera borealis]
MEKLNPLVRAVRSTSIFETLESRQLMSAAVQSIDGTGNNLANALWGSTGQSLLRLAPSAYADGIATPSGASRPSARAVSNAIAAHGAEEIPSSNHLSAYAYLWGQFIDHDLDLTNSATPSEAFDVAVPTGDTYFDPAGTGNKTIGLTRSKYAAGTGVTSPRQQVNDITAFMDGSMVYGSDAVRAAALRTGTGGLMKTSAGDLLPFNTMGLENATLGGPASASFVAGDVRANENVELTSLQTLWVREHNRIATSIAAKNPSLSDEQIYQKARRTVIAEIQAITYNEYLPALLGKNAIKAYTGYKPKVNPGISNEFSTAAFRLGHSMLPDDVEFLDNNGNEVRDPIALANAFFNPSIVQETGVDPILKYLASSNSEEIDTKVVDGLRNFLFGQPGSGGFDLVSLNIQRGRDHGLSDYNSTRAALGLPKVTSFAQITSDVDVQNALQSLYGSVDSIDLWVGGLAENHVPGSNLGQTFQRILVDQFTRLRDGDRFWYQNVMSRADADKISRTTLADVIRRNSGVQNIQPNVFVFEASISGRVWEDVNADHRPGRGERGVAGREVSLVDADGATVQTVETDASGRYHFGDVALGSYTIQLQNVTGWSYETVAPAPIMVTRGGDIGRVDVAARQAGVTPPVLPPAQVPPPIQIPPPTTVPPTVPQQPPMVPPRLVPAPLQAAEPPTGAVTEIPPAAASNESAPPERESARPPVGPPPMGEATLPPPQGQTPPKEPPAGMPPPPMGDSLPPPMSDALGTDGRSPQRPPRPVR